MSRLAALPSHGWDILVVGGGITGAGILREAARLGLRALLVEQNDFASGTSSRSSKLVHGGLRYLTQGQIGLMRESIHERARLLRDGPGLVEVLGYLHAIYRHDRMSARTFETALRVYALLHGRWRIHRRLPPSAAALRAPGLNEADLAVLFEYGESQTDDARLVLRVLREATERGAVALNYTTAAGLLRDEHGQVTGADLQDRETGQPVAVRARAVINATGAWADHLRAHVNAPPRLRPMRGSHLVFPGWRLRLGQVVSFFHPENGRPVFCVPWEGVVLVGTTDVDQHEPLDAEPRPSPDEIHFLLSGVQARFPRLDITLADVQAVYAGVRPVADTHTLDPTKASREHVIWLESGLLTVTGGKLTTFRPMALSTLEKLRTHLPDWPPARPDTPALDPLPPLPSDLPLPASQARRWLARYGSASLDFLLSTPLEERRPFWRGPYVSRAELRWIARNEGVRHLDDLLLRRTRLGLTAPQGGARLLEQIRSVAQPELNWSDDQWQAEVARYLALWQQAYSVISSEAR